MIKLEKEEYYDSLKTPENEFFNNPKLFKIEEKNDKVQNLLKKYSSLRQPLGLIPNREFTIDLKDSVPVRSTPYPIPFHFYGKVKDEINRLLHLNIIKKSFSAYGSPCFAINKKNGSIRLVVDYRRLNTKLDDSAYPFPNIWDQLKSIPSSKYFSQIDITMGYHNVKIRQNDIPKTAFVLPWGQYEFNRIPFGIKTAPRCFQHIMSEILSEYEFVKVFIDDILIFSNTYEKHLIHLDKVLTALAQNNVSVNFEKSNFGKHTVHYLGYVIDEHGIKANHEKIKGFKQTLPKIGKATAKQIKGVIGFIEWFRPFIPNLSAKIDTINEKTRKNVKKEWTENDQITIM